MELQQRQSRQEKGPLLNSKGPEGLNWDVCFAPKSRHQSDIAECPLCASSGHRDALFDHLVGELVKL